ncbi:MAG: PPC domain-containing protein [Acidobacteria bacterium]|nr:PPC domain-containing protein [Acidobacteriota bacterium]
MAFLLLLTTAAAAATPPLIRDLKPRGAQRGAAVQLVIRGDGLTPGARIETTIPGSATPLVPATTAMRPNTELVWLVELRKDAPAGLYPVRVITEGGLSNVALFAVGMLPEVEEKEKDTPKPGNGTIERAEAVPAPVVVNGELTGPDVDVYRIDAKSGERLVFEVEARRAGSAIDPVIEVLDVGGHVLAKNDDAPAIGVDARTEVSFAKAGPYFVRVHDSKFSEQAQRFYRLKIGAYSYADAIFPLGGRRGQEVEFTFSGGNLAAPVAVRKKLDGSGPLALVGLPESASLPFMVAIGDQPEAPESAALQPGTLVNGRIEKPGEVDKYKLAVTPGQNWIVELTAAELGVSPLDALITVYGPDGKKLFSRDDLASADPALPFKAPEGVSEVTVAVEDLLGRGGPAFGYRLEARQEVPDFVAEVTAPVINIPAGGTAAIPVTVQRRGYEGPLHLRVEGVPEGVRVAGGHVPSEAAAQSPFTDNMGFRAARGLLTLTAPAEMPVQALRLNVLAEAEIDGHKVVRAARMPGMVVGVRGTRQKPFTAPWLDAALPAAIAGPLPVSLTVPVGQVRISQGFEYEARYAVKRQAGVRLSDRVRQRVTGAVGNLRLNKGGPSKSPDAGSILMATNFASPVGRFDMVWESEAEIDGRTVPITSPAVEFEIVQGYDIALASSLIDFRPGEPFAIRGRVHREPTFEGALVRVQTEDLPEGVKCAPAEVPEDRSEFALTCEAGKASGGGTYEIRISSVAPNVGRRAKDDYKIPALAVKLTTAKAMQAEVR